VLHALATTVDKISLGNSVTFTASFTPAELKRHEKCLGIVINRHPFAGNRCRGNNPGNGGHSEPYGRMRAVVATVVVAVVRQVRRVAHGEW